jgi:hypothetical protein
LGARTETEKTGIFTKQKSESVARTTVELFCEGKSPGFSVESRDPTGEFGLTSREMEPPDFTFALTNRRIRGRLNQDSRCRRRLL